MGKNPCHHEQWYSGDWFRSVDVRKCSWQTRGIWREMLDIHADQVFSIGIINSTLQPVLVNNRLRNVPSKAFYNWNPGAYFGVYKPDTFWYASP